MYINPKKTEQTTEVQLETGDISALELPPPRKMDPLPRLTTLTLRPKEAKSQKKKKKGITGKAFVSSAASKDTMLKDATRKRTVITNEAHDLLSNEI